MAPHRFYAVDVCAERQYAGNQLAVVCGTSDLSDNDLRQIARETNFSETTFVTAVSPAERSSDGPWRRSPL